MAKLATVAVGWLHLNEMDLACSSISSTDIAATVGGLEIFGDMSSTLRDWNNVIKGEVNAADSFSTYLAAATVAHVDKHRVNGHGARRMSPGRLIATYAFA